LFKALARLYLIRLSCDGLWCKGPIDRWPAVATELWMKDKDGR
jgi:hypothetical protein